MSANEEVEVKIVEEVFVDGELAELVIIEEFAKRGEKPPHAKTYVIFLITEITMPLVILLLAVYVHMKPAASKSRTCGRYF